VFAPAARCCRAWGRSSGERARDRGACACPTAPAGRDEPRGAAETDRLTVVHPSTAGAGLQAPVNRRRARAAWRQGRGVRPCARRQRHRGRLSAAGLAAGGLREWFGRHLGESERGAPGSRKRAQCLKRSGWDTLLYCVQARGGLHGCSSRAAAPPYGLLLEPPLGPTAQQQPIWGGSECTPKMVWAQPPPPKKPPAGRRAGARPAPRAACRAPPPPTPPATRPSLTRATRPPTSQTNVGAPSRSGCNQSARVRRTRRRTPPPNRDLRR